MTPFALISIPVGGTLNTTVNRVRNSKTLLEVTKYLGRFKKMLAKMRKNSYAFGRGEKYTLESGNNLRSVIMSEYSMLALRDTMPLFLRKYQGKKLNKFKR